MKTAILLFTFLLLSSAELYGQYIPNPGFENWTLNGGQYFTPDGWTTNAADITTRVDRETPGQTGCCALKLQTTGYARIKFFLPNYPFNLNGFVKTDIIPDDSVTITISVYSANNVIGTTEWVNTNSLPGWTPLSISLSDSLAFQPDSVEILIESGVLYSTTPSGTLWKTTISVDNLSISPITGMEDAKNNNVTVFPNPFTESISINTNSPEPFHFTLYDVTGKVVLERTIVQNTKISVPDLPQGIYFYEVRNKAGAERGKLVKN